VIRQTGSVRFNGSDFLALITWSAKKTACFGVQIRARVMLYIEQPPTPGSDR
jgi:hypothetical protein